MVKEAIRDKGLIILIKSIFDQIDEVANLKSKNKSAKISSLMLQEMSKILPELSKEDQEKYFELLIILSESVTIPKQNMKLDASFVENSIPAKKKTIIEIRKILEVA